MNKKSIFSMYKISYLLMFGILYGLFFQIPTTVFAEDLGSLEIELKYENMDRVSPWQTVLEIFQDGNKQPFTIIEFPDSNPYLLESLPLDHKYTVKVYVNDMYAEEKFIILDEEREKLEILIPLQAGMQFVVLYNDGATPIEGAAVSIKSDKGKEWASGNTNSEGKTIRFWLQSNNQVLDDYYIVEVSLTDDLSHTKQPITFYPKVIGDIEIILPWAENIENLVTVQVYKDVSQKVEKEDGEFFVELYDSKNDKISESKVNNRGEAFFSNFKIGKYSIIVVKSDEQSKQWATKNITITGDEGFISVFKTGVLSDSSIVTCNCVAFRLDDVQDYYLRGPQISIIEAFQQKNADLTVGIIGSAFGADSQLVNYLKRMITNDVATLEVASHSYSNARLPTLDKNDQQVLLEKTNQVLDKSLGIVPKTLIPPQNLFNDDTLEVATELGFTHISGHIEEKHTPPYFDVDSEIFYFPANTQTAKLNPDGITWEKQNRSVVLEEIRGFIDKYGYAVVMMHPYEFTISEFGAYTTETDKQMIEEIGKMIDEIKELKIEIVTISEINKKVFQPGQQPDLKEDIEEEIIHEDSHCAQPFGPFVNLSNCNLSNQELFQANLTAADLSGVDFSGSNFKRIDFTNTILSKSNISETDYFQGILTGADLTYANLTNSKIEEVAVLGTDFSNAILKGITISNLSAEGSNFSNADLTNAIVKGAGFKNTLFSGADLSDSIFSGINLSNSKFDDANLSGINLVGATLTGADLTNVDLTGADLSNTILRDANLSNAILLQVILSETDITNSNLSNTNLSGIDLTGIVLKNIDFTGADLTNSNLSGSDLSGSILNGVDLTGADLSGVILREVDLSSIILKGINLSGVDLSGSNLDGIDLSDTILKGTNLSQSSLKSALISGADLSNAILNGVNLSEAIFENINFSNAEMQETDLSKLDLRKAILTGTNLSNANLSEANLSGVDLTGAILDNVNFQDANMQRISLSGVDLSGINFAGSDLRGIDLSHSNLNDANFSETNLESADLFESKIINTDFSGADMSNTDLNFKDIENAITDDKTLLPEKGFFFFRELYSLFRIIFGF